MQASRGVTAPLILLLVASCKPDLPPGLGDRIADSEVEVVDGTGSAFDPGERIRLSDLEGKPVVLNFWASWCGPCKAQHAYLADLKARYGDRIEVLGILYEDQPGNARDWLQRNGAHFPTVQETEGTLRDEFWVNGIPRLILLTPDRRLSWDQMGAGDWGRDSLELRLDQMIG
jgi:cytochrome c biogenesis protein CcmG/thiol:disulfide interchange protein DsbE